MITCAVSQPTDWWSAPSQVSRVHIRTTLITVLLLQVILLRDVLVKAWGSNQTSLTRRYLLSMEWNAYLFNHLVNFFLPHEQNRGSKNALEEFFPDTFVDTSDTLVLYDREDTLERGLVLGVTGLKPTLHNTKSRG